MYTLVRGITIENCFYFIILHCLGSLAGIILNMTRRMFEHKLNKHIWWKIKNTMTWPEFISQGQCMHMFSNNKANICFTSTFSDFVPGVIDWASTMSLGSRWGFWIFFSVQTSPDIPQILAQRVQTSETCGSKGSEPNFLGNKKTKLKWNPHPTKKWGGEDDYDPMFFEFGVFRWKSWNSTFLEANSGDFTFQHQHHGVQVHPLKLT